MAEGQGRSGNQKLKLLYLKKFFEERTDEDHPATMQDIIDYLAAHGVKAERKSIYTDLDALYEFGIDVRNDDHGRTYQLHEREFEFPEVKLIIDSVATSKFLSEQKSMTLIKKLGSLCSEYQRQQLSRDIHVQGRAKTMNNSTLYAVDTIQTAIRNNVTVTFKYVRYNVQKEREYSYKGAIYEVSPWALLYDNDNYYLRAFTDGEFKTYRVDRMGSVNLGNKERQGKD